MNLPLPENSLPDNPLFPFDLNPLNNQSTGGSTNAHHAGVNFDRIEMYLPNSGVDDFIPFINKNPPSGNRSIRLNNWRTGRHVNTMERTFIVEAGATELTFYAAIVLEDPDGHDDTKPYFKALLLDCEDEVVDEICLVSGTTDTILEAGIFSGKQMSYADWRCYIFDISSYDCQILTLRFITAGCGQIGHFGYSYIADICEPCSGSPQWELDCDEGVGCDPVYCPEEFPLVYCGWLKIDTAEFTVDSIYAELVNGETVFETLEPVVYQYEDSSVYVCFEISEELYNSLPNQGYDIYFFAEVTNKSNDFTSIISSNSFVPNSPGDINNDFYVTCCPAFTLDTLDLCETEYLELCGVFDSGSCDIDVINFTLTIMGVDTIPLVINLELDSLDSFCYHIADSLLAEWDEYCVRILVEVEYYDPIVGDTLFLSEEFENLDGGCLFDQECCPEADPVSVSLNRVLCLTGVDYSTPTFDISGGILMSNLPDGFEYCGQPPEFNGGFIDYTSFSVLPHAIQFEGVLHITDTSHVIYNDSTNQYCITGSLLVCDESNQECEIEIIMCLSGSQGDMCFEMEGLMCMNFLVNTSPYFPHSGNPPLVVGDSVKLPLRIAVPFVDKFIIEGDTCTIDTYWFEVYGVSSSSIPSHELLHQSVLHKQGNQTTGIFQEELTISISDWNSYDYIEVKFWNNCGDTCTAREIPVVPVGGGGDRSIPEIEEDKVNVNAYPIPFGEQVMINYQLTQEKTEYRVYDSSGRLIDQGLFSDREGEYLLNTRQWSSGWYIFEINDPKLKDRTLILIKE